ncbi:hypothetical protein QBC37DRAFT_441074 [Rhypophila decipiens]|uniref:C2H2-type domain-containing protein n=1 Tax=Rhypophila decipiens TaxID=261697 RepID=A0AAN7B9F6_9PEZI|nr:hypothetical protein QBC37DRAFT_441074 [Rhypophila decipiens]
MFECGDCDRVFPAGWRARDQHCDATGHHPPDFECDTCDEWFCSEASLHVHMNSRNHWSEGKSHECAVCPSRFFGKVDCTKHEISDHWHCSDCDRTFQSKNNINMHMNSRVHRGRDMKCPFCKKPYTTATGMVHHLEAGSCPVAKNLSRDQVYRFVRQKDPTGIISKKLIGWTGEPSYEVTSKSWDGDCYRCVLCQRGFGSVRSLQAHLDSPFHKQALYHCPNRNCGMEFKVLAAVINHLESESCNAMRFETVQRHITDLVSSDRRLEF